VIILNIDTGMYNIVGSIKPEIIKKPKKRVKESYDRYDPDTNVIQHRNAGSFYQTRRDKKIRKLSKIYKEFNGLPMDYTLGMARNIYEVIGLDALRKSIRKGKK